jgi:3-dehydroquinate synthase
LADRSYPIIVTLGNYSSLGEGISEHCGARSIVIICDDKVATHYLDPVTAKLAEQGFQVFCQTVPAGEGSKKLAVVEGLYDSLFDHALERSDAIVALGGGVIGDLAGFVAATFKRGLDYVQVPTSLLAMVDSSVGGKTGINHPRGKNMIGSFHQPRLVYSDITALSTLPARELSCGLAETVKHAVIRDGQFFDWLESNSDKIMNLDNECMLDLVHRNCSIKAAVVATDERESGLRGILNFGHTIGHALEILYSPKGMLHGEAISLGMVAASRLAVRRNMIPDETASRLEGLLKAFNLPVRLEDEVVVESVQEAIKNDKKVQAGKIKFVLPTAIGDCSFVEDLTSADIQWAVESLNG